MMGLSLCAFLLTVAERSLAEEFGSGTKFPQRMMPINISHTVQFDWPLLYKLCMNWYVIHLRAITMCVSAMSLVSISRDLDLPETKSSIVWHPSEFIVTEFLLIYTIKCNIVLLGGHWNTSASFENRSEPKCLRLQTLKLISFTTLHKKMIFCDRERQTSTGRSAFPWFGLNGLLWFGAPFQVIWSQLGLLLSGSSSLVLIHNVVHTPIPHFSSHNLVLSGFCFFFSLYISFSRPLNPIPPAL